MPTLHLNKQLLLQVKWLAVCLVFVCSLVKAEGDSDRSVLGAIDPPSQAQGFDQYFNARPPEHSPLVPLPPGYLARIELNSPDDIERALLRAETMFRDGDTLNTEEPLVFVLHGPEVAVFFRDIYAKYKSLVDLAARLSALEVIDVRVCRTRMGVLGREESALVPFVSTVPFGPAEVERLLNTEKYVYF